MTTYAIGDVQGCYTELMQLLRGIGFRSDCDRLWFVGDLVNRGPDSLKVLRFVRKLGEQATTVLGNHDLHLLALAHGVGKPRRLDTFDELMSAGDRDEILQWLACQPLLHHDEKLQMTMVHAGLPPQWGFELANACAKEAEAILCGNHAQDFYPHMYGNQPDCWHPDLRGWDRIRYIVNCFSRIRYCDSHGRLDLQAKGPLSAHQGLQPWFSINNRQNKNMNIVFGHWSALGFYQHEGVICLDSGCLWGGSLSAIRLESPQIRYSIHCAQKLAVE